MSSDRDSRGRFKEGGRSGNPAGRPRGTSRSLRTPEDLANVIMKIMNRKVPQGAVDDGLPRISTFERSARAMMSTNPSVRLAAERTMERAEWAAEILRQADHRRRVEEEQRSAELKKERETRRRLGLDDDE